MEVNSVAVVNKSGLSDKLVALYVEAYRRELPDFCAKWGIAVPGVVFYDDSHKQNIPEEAMLIFVDSGNDPDAFGWHEILGAAVFGYIDVNLSKLYDEPIDRVFGHEFWEMVLNPDLRWIGPYPDGTHVPKEACDACQDCSWAVQVDDPLLGHAVVQIADWVFPNWFTPGSEGPWSAQGNAPGPLLDTPGGYHLISRNGVLVSSAMLKSNGRSVRLLGQLPNKFAAKPSLWPLPIPRP